ncbi:hypothetical protein CEXT_147431, partial [Caerostris extrusa]
HSQCYQGLRAYELIESYPLTSENYPKVISAFTERFGNQEILTEIYVRELLKLITQNVHSQGKDKLSLMSLFDKIESHIRALESLGVKKLQRCLVISHGGIVFIS